jgi:hypothetical protein
MFSRSLALASVVISISSAAGQAASPDEKQQPAPARLQFGGLDGKPLLAVVEVKGNFASSDSWGTGTGFLANNCTVLTNIHVLEPGIIMSLRSYEDEGEKGKKPLYKGRPLDDKSFVGNEYPFRTQPLDSDKKRLYSKLRVLAHGNYSQGGGGSGRGAENANDWAIGEDLECLSVKAHLGSYRISSLPFDLLKGRDIHSAGFKTLPGTPMNGEILVVDPQCTITAAPRHDLWETTCFSAPKGSGSVAGVKGHYREVADILFAVGLFVGGGKEFSYMIPLVAIYSDSEAFRTAIDTERVPR